MLANICIYFLFRGTPGGHISHYEWLTKELQSFLPGKNYITLSDALNRILKESGLSLRQLEKETGISKSSIHRIIHGYDRGKGRYCTSRIFSLLKLSCAFHLSKEQATTLIYIAYPEYHLLLIAIDRQMSCIDASNFLDDYGFDSFFGEE